MKMFLAESGGLWGAYFKSEQFAHAYILQSFFYADDFTERHIIPNAADFILDSGAFTFMQSAKNHVNWDEYIERYADFINRNHVDKFFELDIDSVVGYERVKQIRKRLERLTGRQSIPVWHVSRGKDEFIRHAQEYPYVADDAMRTLFSLNLRISLASMVMYFVANMADVKIFTKMKEKGTALWLRNNVATIVCNCLENFGFIWLAFVGIYDTATILEIALATSAVEMIVAVLDTPFIYVARKLKQKE